MKVERVFYGMVNGKIDELTTDGVRNLISYKNLEYLRTLKPEDSGKHLWLKSEQTIAFPIVREVKDMREGKGGRTWVQIQTFLVNIHDYLNDTAKKIFEPYIMPELTELPKQFDPIII